MLQTTIETLVEGMETKDTSNHDTIIATMDNNILADWINAKVRVWCENREVVRVEPEIE